MQTTQRAKQNTPEEQDKRKEKERKREEKELRKIAAAAGVRMAKPTTTTLAPVVPPVESKPVGFKKSSWASVSSVTPEPPSYTESPPARSGWGAAGSSVPSQSSPGPDAISSAGYPTTTPVAPSQPGDPSIPEPSREAQRQHHQPAPAFRAGGWSSIDSTTRLPPPPTPAPDVPASAIANIHRQQGHLTSGPASASITPSAPEAVPAAVHLPPPVTPHSQVFASPRTEVPKSSKSKKEREAEMRENSRSGWQSFQKGGRRK